MRKGINLFLAISVLCGLGTGDLAMAQGSSGDAGASGSGSNQAAPASQSKGPRLGRRLRRRLGKMKGRLHRKKKAAPANGSGSSAPTTPQN